MNRALFTDLDGTLINTKSKHKFPKDQHDWEFNEKMIRTIKIAKEKGLQLVIVTNQGGIETGHVSETAFVEKMLDICTELQVLTGYVLGEDLRYYYSSTTDKTHYSRKPNPGMAFQAATDLYLNLRGSVMIGDASGRDGDHSADDLNFARRSGIGRYLDVREFTPTGDMFITLVKRDKGTFQEEKDRKDFLDATIE